MDDQTFADRTYADRTYADRTYADRTYADRTYADRTYADRTYPDRTYADATSYYPRTAAQGSSRSPSRLTFWSVFFLFSLIVMGTTLEATDRVHATQKGARNQKWAVACSVISFGAAVAMMVLHVLPTGFGSVVGSKLELAFSFMMLVNCSMTVALVSSVTNGLAVDTDGGVSFGNLYYFSWAAFVTAFYILVDYFKGVYGWEVADQLRNRSSRLDLWLTFLLCNLVLMASASNVYDYMCVSHRQKMLCNRTLLAIIIGLTGSVFSVIIIGMKASVGFAPLLLEAFTCGLLFLTNCFAIALITSEFGPGAKIGNLYYAEWATLLTSFVLVASCHEDYMASKDEQMDEMSRYYDNDDDGMTFAGRSVAQRSLAGKSVAERTYVGPSTSKPPAKPGKLGKMDEASVAGETAAMSMWT